MAAVIIVVVVIAGFFIYKGAGPRTDGPSAPIDMGAKMDQGKLAPPTRGPGGGMGMPAGSGGTRP